MGNTGTTKEKEKKKNQIKKKISVLSKDMLETTTKHTQSRDSDPSSQTEWKFPLLQHVV